MAFTAIVETGMEYPVALMPAEYLCKKYGGRNVRLRVSTLR